MQNIAVGVITFQRPLELERLLNALAAQTYETLPPPTLTVVVVDNAAGGSARSVCDAAVIRHGLKISYILEPRQGIPIARNRVLDSLPDDCEAIAWIDDDEAPSPQWIESLILTHKGSGADFVLGAVEAVLPDSTPLWVKKGGFFNRRRFVDRATLTEGATNNSLMLTAPLRQHNLRFDETLRYAGGTDTLFFRTGENKGLRMVWSAKALVYDYVHPERTTLRWLMRRHFRAGVTLAICDWRLKGWIGALTRFGFALSKLFQGLISLPVGFEGMHEFAKALLMLARGAGMIAGLLGLRVDEFKPQRPPATAPTA